MSKPGDFSFIQNNDIRLSYRYAYRSITNKGLWDLLKQLTLTEIFKHPEFTGLKLRKGSSWARTLQVMHQIANTGWETVVEELKNKQNAGQYP